MAKVTQDDLWVDLKTRDPKLIQSKYGSVMAALSHGLRGAITAAPGKVLYVADYAGIEARVVMWLAGDEDALEIFRTGADIYCYMADSIYGYKTHKDTHPKERGLGKIAVLGLGYQMGPSKFVESCAAANPPIHIEEDLECARCHTLSRDHRNLTSHEFTRPVGAPVSAVEVVDAFRSKFWRLKELWDETEKAAIKAVLTRKKVRAGKVTFHVEGRFLYCTLPSGRRLAYADPWVKDRETPWGETRPQLSFMGVNPLNKQWQRQTTYGGSLVENITQAVARDIMAAAMFRVEASRTYLLVLTVHDEIIAEADEGTGDVKEFEHLLTIVPDWAEGCPIGAEGWTGFRYHK